MQNKIYPVKIYSKEKEKIKNCHNFVLLSSKLKTKNLCPNLHNLKSIILEVIKIKITQFQKKFLNKNT